MPNPPPITVQLEREEAEALVEANVPPYRDRAAWKRFTEAEESGMDKLRAALSDTTEAEGE